MVAGVPRSSRRRTAPPSSCFGIWASAAGVGRFSEPPLKFSTKDFDNDQWQDGNCAEMHSGAWWYNGCETSNLNGLYLNGELPEMHEYKGMYWYDWHGPRYSLMAAKMMIRPRSESLEGLGASKTNATKAAKPRVAEQRIKSDN